MRTSLLVLSLAGSLAACEQAAPPPPPRQNVDPAIVTKRALSNDDLMAVLHDLAAYTPPDQFSPPFDPSGLRGKHVDLVFLAPANGGPASGEAYAFTWHYTPEKQLLNASFNEAAFVTLKYADGHPARGGTRVRRSVPLAAFATSATTSAGWSLFGMPRRAATQTFDERALVEFEKFAPNQKSPAAYLIWSISLPPAEARVVAPQLRVHLTGVIAPGRSGELAACETHKAVAMLADPQVLTHRTCYVSVRIRRIELEGVPRGAKVSKKTI